MTKTLLSLAPLTLAMACSGGGNADGDGDGEISGEEAAAEMEAADINITPGQWEATVQLTEFDMPEMPEEMRGMMQEQMGETQTSASCITPEQAADPEGNMFGGEENDNCTYNEFNMSGGRMLIDATCQPEGAPGTMTMRMEGNYSATSYDLTMNMSMEQGPMGPMTMGGRVRGRHISDDCGEAAG